LNFNFLLSFIQGTLFSVFDGHGGPSCAQVVAKRLFDYIAAAMLPNSILKELASPNDPPPPGLCLLESYNDNFELVEDLAKLYSKSFHQFMYKLQKRDDKEFSMEEVLTKAFLHLDEDISNEAKLEKLDPSRKIQPDSLHMKTLSVGLSGSVGCVAHVDQEHLHVASCGDCKTVIGTWNYDNESWFAQVITDDHNAENSKEVERILSEHPESERDYIIRNDRLFGQLAPLRAFGDIRQV
jgi:pyruvate dehydrogenase phosphatase